ncbi:MAG: universal stress protein [Pseudomonadota bacterium]|nr:universal stress protein [Pseudomonadota bacterium]
MEQPQHHIVACLDGSMISDAVCDAAHWAGTRLQAPIQLLHVVPHMRAQQTDMTGNLHFGENASLLADLADLDEQRSKIALKQGRLLLDAAQRYLTQQQPPQTVTEVLRTGYFAEQLQHIEPQARLIVLGKQGHDSEHQLDAHIGSELEHVIRRLHRPILITSAGFQAPTSALIAFDGSNIMQNAIQLIASSPLLRDLPLHVVMVNAATVDAQAQMDWVKQALSSTHAEVHTAIRQGDVEQTLHAYQAQHQLDLLVMGAYGHSRLRQFFVGSTTTKMLVRSQGSVLLLR